MTRPAEKRTEIAVVGDRDLVAALRLAGVRRTFVIAGERNSGDAVRKALRDCLSDPDVGVVVLLEAFAEAIGDTLSGYRRSRRALPVIVTVPCRRGTRHPDATAYYRQFSREFLGFDIEL